MRAISCGSVTCLKRRNLPIIVIETARTIVNRTHTRNRDTCGYEANGINKIAFRNRTERDQHEHTIVNHDESLVVPNRDMLDHEEKTINGDKITNITIQAIEYCRKSSD